MSAPSDITYFHHAFFEHVGHTRQNSADKRRQSSSQRKLAGFSETHLVELSADMYDELQRRLHPERFPPGPLVHRHDIHWKRNDARKHVGSLPSQRFDDICRDLLDEQERRYPELKSLPEPSAETPQPRTRPGRLSMGSAASSHSDVYAFPLSASPHERGQGPETFDNTEPSGSQSPNFNMQSVAESKIEPKKTQIVESDDESDNESDADSLYEDNYYPGKVPEGPQTRDTDAEESNHAHERDLSEASGRTSYMTLDQEPPSRVSSEVHDHDSTITHDRYPPINRSGGELQDDDTLAAGQAVPHLDVEHLTARLRELETENEQHRAEIDELRGNQSDPDLERTLSEQRSITEQVRQEAARFLEEMRALTRRHEEQIDRADSMDAEAKHWHKRYNKVVAELEATKSQRLSTAIEQPQLTSVPPDWISSTGAVSEQQLRQYLNAVAALVACVHSDKGKRSDALQFLHAVVLATRALTQGKHSLVAKSANLLITVVRNFAVSKGLMPLIIVDSACSDLTMAIIDLCSKQKVRVENQLQQTEAHRRSKSSVSFQFDEKRNRELPKLASSQEGTSQIDEPRLATPIEPESPQTPVSASRPVTLKSTSTPSTPTSVRSRETGKFRPPQGPQMPPDSSIQSLQTYLEEQTSGTVDAIGALLAGIKDNAVAGEIKPRVGEIKELVGQMIDATNSAISETRNRLLREKGTLIVENLNNCLARMDMLLDEELEAIRDDAKPNRHLKQRLAGVSFDMAKSTKELVKTVEEATLKDELEGIDRQL